MRALPSIFCLFLLVGPTFAQKPVPHPLSRFVTEDAITAEYYRGLEGPLFTDAEQFFDAGDYTKAAESFLELYEQTTIPVALMLAGNCYYRMDEADEAIRLYLRSIEEGLDELSDVHSNLANAYYARYRHDEAISEFERVLELTDNVDPVANYGLGILLDGKGEHDLAIEHYQRVVDFTDDREPLARQHLGLSYFMKGDYPSAIRELDIYIRQVPDDPGGNLNLAIALRYAGALDRAIEQLNIAIENSADPMAAAHYQLARIYEERQEYPLALQHFEIAMENGLNTPRVEEEYEAAKKAMKKVP